MTKTSGNNRPARRTWLVAFAFVFILFYLVGGGGEPSPEGVFYGILQDAGEGKLGEVYDRLSMEQQALIRRDEFIAHYRDAMVYDTETLWKDRKGEDVVLTVQAGPFRREARMWMVVGDSTPTSTTIAGSLTRKPKAMNARNSIRFPMLGIVLFALLPSEAQSQQPAPVKKLILPGESFLVEQRPAFILLPPKEKRSQPQPWILYAPTLPGLPDRHEKWMHEQFLAAGVAVAGIDIGEAYGSPQGQKWMTALYNELTGNRGFAAQPCLLGRSRGGLMVTSWAIAHPDKVAGIAGIYPVLDLRSYPGVAKAAGAYGLTAAQLESQLAKHNPIARVDVLAKRKLPVHIIHGDSDKVVPLEANSAALAARYKAAGAADAVTLTIAKQQGHNFFEGFFRSPALIDFAVQRAKAGVAAKAQ